MSATTGLTKNYYSFLRHLGRPSVKRRIAPLQLVGKIEDYLTKEFASHIHCESEGRRFVIVNSGSKGEPKIDMAVIKPATGGHQAEALVEAKYFRNRHRLSPHDMSAVDEHIQSIRELSKQISFVPLETQGLHSVGLRSRTTKVYGLVFVSYTRPDDADDRKDKYFSSFLKSAGNFGFHYHDLKKPYLRSAYEDSPTTVLGMKWRITLRIGLWRMPVIGNDDEAPNI